MQHYEPVNLGFSTADGENVVIHYDKGDIRFQFKDWTEKNVQFTAVDVMAFSWGEADFNPSMRDDICYEVMNSDLIQQYIKLNLVTNPASHHHYKMCFNACGVFDVICQKVEMKQVS